MSDALRTPLGKPESRGRRSDILPALAMGGPAFFLLLLFLIGPFFAGIWFSFTDQRLISPDPTKFVGLRNYDRMLHLAILPLDPLVNAQTGQLLYGEDGSLQYPRSRQFTRDEDNYPQYAGLTEWFNLDIGTKRFVLLAGDPSFFRSLLNNVFFSLVVIPLQTGMGLVLALLVNQRLKGRNIFRTMYFAPVVTSMVVVSIVWRFLYDYNNGMINVLLSYLTFGNFKPINWLGDPSTAMIAIIIMSAWQGAGMQMMLFLAGLQGIPEEIYEAASIDGANSWQKFLYVTLPGLRNTSIFIIITITIAAFQLFTQVFVMTNGGPSDATTTVTFMMVREGFREQNIAYASAIAVVFFLLILGISLIQRRVLHEEVA
ncbi:MAG: sugar ABC transporter permease [Chloroflexota bacterium]